MNQQLFDSMTDEEIVRYIRQGHKEGMEYLLDKYKELVRNRARSLYLMGGEREDLIQEGMIGLFKAIQGFDETKDASFQSFADLCVKNIVRSIPIFLWTASLRMRTAQSGPTTRLPQTAGRSKCLLTGKMSAR